MQTGHSGRSALTTVSNPVKTGDDAPILLYLGIGAGALVLAGALTVLYLHRRKQKDNQ